MIRDSLVFSGTPPPVPSKYFLHCGLDTEFHVTPLFYFVSEYNSESCLQWRHRETLGERRRTLGKEAQTDNLRVSRSRGSIYLFGHSLLHLSRLRPSHTTELMTGGWD